MKSKQLTINVQLIIISRHIGPYSVHRRPGTCWSSLLLHSIALPPSQMYPGMVFEEENTVLGAIGMEHSKTIPDLLYVQMVSVLTGYLSEHMPQG